MNKNEIKEALKEMFASGEIRIDLDGEEHPYIDGATRVIPIVSIDGETIYTGSHQLVKTVF